MVVIAIKDKPIAIFLIISISINVIIVVKLNSGSNAKINTVRQFALQEDFM